MRVTLFRHGLAHDRSDPACPADPERALTDEGKKKTRRAAKGLGVVGCRPTRILTSPYVRARQTAELVAEVLGLGADRITTTEALLPE
ncbi:MAG: phosphohistidine phosphatase SixA, partial [Deltaproteobacteria bacterium]|nr:phosphohistidine phosphatase SixA [Deltaproteobacteria bacterium]